MAQAPVSEYSNPMDLLNQQIVDYPSFKLVSVGKTTFVKRHLTGEFEKKYKQRPLVSKFTLWTFSQTVGKSDFIAGIPQGKRNSVVLEMVTSERIQHDVVGTNCLMGNIPMIFGKGNQLEILNLNGNQFEGPVTRSLTNCRQLLVLDLGNNKINDIFPYWLGTLPELQFTGDLTELESLDLSSNQLIGKIPNQLKRR
ncbi:unnamed protein product [Camellia sinensis]